jgi:hypothetical protein
VYYCWRNRREGLRDDREVLQWKVCLDKDLPSSNGRLVAQLITNLAHGATHPPSPITSPSTKSPASIHTSHHKSYFYTASRTMPDSNSPPSSTREHYISDQLTSTSAPILDEAACPICYDDWNRNDELIVRTHCNHTFHRECFVAWLSKDDVDSANSCPSCRAVCFPRIEHRIENVLVLDTSFLYTVLRSEYILQPSEPAQSASRVVRNDDMARLAFGDEEDAD